MVFALRWRRLMSLIDGHGVNNHINNTKYETLSVKKQLHVKQEVPVYNQPGLAIVLSLVVNQPSKRNSC